MLAVAPESTQMTGCSSDELLVRFLDEQIDGDAYAAIVEHIETCDHCQRRLEKFTKEEAESSGLPSRLGDSMDSRFHSVVATPVRAGRWIRRRHHAARPFEPDGPHPRGTQ